MFARVAMSTVRTEKIEETRKTWESEVIPTMKSQKGFRNVYVLGNDKEKKIITISLWESEADAAAWEKHPQFGMLREKSMAAVTSPGRIEGYEVKLSG